MNNCLRPVLILLAVSVCIGCKKYVPGPKGEPGAPAKQGNLKSTFKSNFTLPSSAWTFDGEAYKAYVPVKELSAAVIAAGDVEVYMQVGDQWWSLPYGTGNLFTQASFETEMMHLDHAMIHDGPPDRPGPTNFRLVIFDRAR